MPGCGKTTLGKIIADKLKINFYDLDEYIQESSNMTIEEMFSIGEDYFRKCETACIYELIKENEYVLSTGGGVVKNPENMYCLKEDSVIFFLNRPLEKIIKDIDNDKRPLLRDNPDKIYELFNERYELYKKYCHYEITNDNDIDKCIYEILGIVNS